MLSKTKLQLIQSLRQKKFRFQHGLFIAEGEKTVAALLQSNFEIEMICALPQWIEDNRNALKYVDDIIETIDEDTLQRISELTTPNKVLAVARMKKPYLNFQNIKHELVLILDDINDPGNLGTIIRIAHWFNISTIVCSEQTVDLYNPKTIQSTMGSAFNVNVFYANLTKFIPDYIRATGNFVYATVINGGDIYKKHLHTSGAVVIGSESHGISPALLNSIPEKITIPSFRTDGTTDSLNAAAATAIVVSEFRRRIDIGL